MTRLTSPSATTRSSLQLSESIPVTRGNQVVISSWEGQLATFLRALEGKNRSPLTRRAYETDIRQFRAWLDDNTYAPTPSKVQRGDISDYLAALGQGGISGVSRARKLAAIREFFRYLESCDAIAKSPATGMETPKRERHERTYLRPEEYTKMLALAGANPRDYAILQVFLQTGVRVSELCDLQLSDVDLIGRSLRVRSGKGMAERNIELEKKGLQAIKNYVDVRPLVSDEHLFLNYQGTPISERGVRKIVAKYKARASITKKISCHSLRHSFATFKAEKGVSPFQLQQWLGHANLNTTQVYVHLARQNARKVMEQTSL